MGKLGGWKTKSKKVEEIKKTMKSIRKDDMEEGRKEQREKAMWQG